MMDPVTIYVAEPKENLPPLSFREVSKKNAGKATLNPDGSVSGYVSGVPFLDPKEPNKVLKIMWNYSLRWRADDFSYPGGYKVATKRKGGSIGYSAADIRQLRFVNRTARDPKPDLLNSNKLFFAQLYISLTAPNKDMATLTWRYEDPFKDDEMWAYVPTLRRTLRLVSSERSNPVRGTPYTWDDFYGFDGQTMKYDFTLVAEKPLLVIMNQHTMAVHGGKYENGLDRPILDGPDDPFELLKTYVIDAKSKNPRSPETKKTLFITATDGYGCVYAEVYDKQGNLWKGQTFNYSKQKTELGETGPWGMGSSISDFKSEFWTYCLLDKLVLDGGLDQNLFTPGALGTF
jgi:hypothetical protein